MEKELIGKTIKKVWKEKIPDGDDGFYDDEPYLFLEMEDGSVFKIISTYGGYTGGSEDEYPTFIRVETLNNPKSTTINTMEDKR